VDISVAELKALSSCGESHSIQVGKTYLIRTVTHYYTGRVVAVTDTDLLLTNAAWIADTGRFATALETGKFNEVEPFMDDVIVARGAIVDATQWRHDLPRSQQ